MQKIEAFNGTAFPVKFCKVTKSCLFKNQFAWKVLEHSKLKNLLIIRNDLWWKRSPSLMPEVEVARLRVDRGDVIVRSGLWHGWWKTSEGSPTKIQLKKPEMIAASKSAHRNSNFLTNRCFRCQVVTSKTEAIKTTRTKMSWSSNDRQEVLLCDWILMGRFRLSYPRSQKLFFTKAFSVWKILNSSKSLVSHLFVAGLEKGSFKTHKLVPSEKVSWGESPEPPKKSFLWEKKSSIERKTNLYKSFLHVS